MGLRFSRLRLVGRWGVSLFALVLIGGTVLSWFYYFGWTKRVVAPFRNDRTVLMAGDGRVWITLRRPVRRSCFANLYETPQVGSSSEFVFTVAREYMQDAYQIGWGNQFAGRINFGSSSVPKYQYYFSGFIPGGFIGLLAMWSWRGVWKRRKLSLLGCCVGCGYSLAGLDGGVCPECGGEG